MKKFISIIALSAICTSLMNSAFAAELAKLAGFTPVQWNSQGANDVKAIVYGDNNEFAATLYVQINVVGDFAAPNVQTTGINIQNCDGVTHLNVGDTAICKLDSHNHLITLRSDKEKVPAMGTYHILK